MLHQPRKCRADGDRLVRNDELIGANFDPVDDKRALQHGIVVGRIERHGAAAGIHQERLARCRIAHEISVRPDQIRRRRALFQEGQIEARARVLVQDHINHREQKRRVGFRLDRNPFGRTGAGHRQMRLDLHPLHAALAGVGMALDAAYAARSLDVGAEGHEIFTERRIGRHREAAMPQLAVEVLGVIALHALPRAEAHVDRPPRRQERRQRAHIGGRRAAAAEARGQARIAGFIGEAFGARLVKLVGDQRQRFFPGDAHKARIFVTPLLRVRPLHRIENAIGVVGFLHQPEGFHASLAAGGMDGRRVEIRRHLGGDAVFDAHLQQIGPSNALVAIGRDGSFVMRARHSDLSRSGAGELGGFRLQPLDGLVDIYHETTMGAGADLLDIVLG